MEHIDFKKMVAAALALLAGLFIITMLAVCFYPRPEDSALLVAAFIQSLGSAAAGCLALAGGYFVLVAAKTQAAATEKQVEQMKNEADRVHAHGMVRHIEREHRFIAYCNGELEVLDSYVTQHAKSSDSLFDEIFKVKFIDKNHRNVVGMMLRVPIPRTLSYEGWNEIGLNDKGQIARTNLIFYLDRFSRVLDLIVQYDKNGFNNLTPDYEMQRKRFQQQFEEIKTAIDALKDSLESRAKQISEEYKFWRTKMDSA